MHMCSIYIEREMLCIYKCLSMHVHIHICIHVCIYLYICMYVVMYVCMYVCIHMYNTHTHAELTFTKNQGLSLGVWDLGCAVYGNGHIGRFGPSGVWVLKVSRFRGLRSWSTRHFEGNVGALMIRVGFCGTLSYNML